VKALLIDHTACCGGLTRQVIYQQSSMLQ